MAKTRVLFLCNRNSARSQMAEGLLRQLYGGKYEAFSAGSNPTRVHPLAVRVMAEAGIDISGQYSKSIREFRDADIDLVVSVCRSSARTACPLCSSPIVADRPEVIRSMLPAAKYYLRHGFSDPSGADGTEEEKVAAFRRTRDEINEWILENFADLEPEKIAEGLPPGAAKS